MFSIKKAAPEDADLATGIFMMLWQGHPFSELKQDILKSISARGSAVFIAYTDGSPSGAAQCSLRHDYVEGANSSPVGYLEGIYVLPQYRRAKVATRLVHCCESWAKARGCSEFASDCALDNTLSQQFHAGVGFAEASRIVCFVKPLESEQNSDSDQLTFDNEMEFFFGNHNAYSSKPVQTKEQPEQTEKQPEQPKEEPVQQEKTQNQD